MWPCTHSAGTAKKASGSSLTKAADTQSAAKRGASEPRCGPWWVTTTVLPACGRSSSAPSQARWRACSATVSSGRSRRAAADWLRVQPFANGRVGVIGFCWGGAMANLLAVRLPWLGAAVAFYGGSQPSGGDVARIKAAVQIHNAGEDAWVDAGAPAYEAALKAAGVRFEAYRYPGTLHGFHNDTTPRYDEAAAKLAWQRALAFLHRHLDA